LVFAAAAYPQQGSVNKYNNNKFSDFTDNQYEEKKIANFIANLSVAIQSENLGLRRSAIYLAGFYSLDEAVPALVNQLEKEENPEVKILISIVLFRIDDPRGMEAVEKLYKNDDNARVKSMSKAVLDEYKNKFTVVETFEK
jgi:HEAT repeat protein